MKSPWTRVLTYKKTSRESPATDVLGTDRGYVDFVSRIGCEVYAAWEVFLWV